MYILYKTRMNWKTFLVVTMDSYPGFKPQFVAQVENAWSDTATPICFDDVQMDNFTALYIHNLFATEKQNYFRNLIKPSLAF